MLQILIKNNITNLYSSFSMKKSYLLLHLAVILAGFTGIFGKLISLNEGLLVWYRLFFSTIILFVVLKLLRIPYSISAQEKVRIMKAGLLITLHWLFFYASIKYSNISIESRKYNLFIGLSIYKIRT